MAGYDHDGPHLYQVRPPCKSACVCGPALTRRRRAPQVDPSGSYWTWKASAIGKNQRNAKTFLEKRCVGGVACGVRVGSKR